MFPVARFFRKLDFVQETLKIVGVLFGGKNGLEKGCSNNKWFIIGVKNEFMSSKYSPFHLQKGVIEAVILDFGRSFVLGVVVGGKFGF